MPSTLAPARQFHPGMGQAVAERTILRPGEGWADVAERVSLGNTMLHESGAADRFDFRNHLRNATILMSGRHLQHGDKDQPARNLEVFSNCSTSAVSFGLFYLLLNGSGVGRSYDDDMMVVDWDNQANVRCVLDESHADFAWGSDESVKDARHKYGKGKRVIWFEVPDSREGWGMAIEKMETLAFQKKYRNHLLVLDFSKVRPKGSPIAGMQDRPSSGPRPMMDALHKIGTLKGAGLEPWLQAMYVDHYLAEPVLVGGARRAARMAVKIWTDKSVLDFIRIKRPNEYDGLTMDEVVAKRAEYFARGETPPFPFLWSSNNSIGVTKDFWRRLDLTVDDVEYGDELSIHAREVLRVATECSYADGTGEPGFLNLDQLTQKGVPPKKISVGSARYQVMDGTDDLLVAIASAAGEKIFYMIVNPCGEIPLALYGGYCVIADLVPFHAESFEEILDSGAHAARALIRVNLMDNFYGPETARTNRIGVGQTGVHEFAWKFFKVGFNDLVAPDFAAYRDLDRHAGPFVDPVKLIEQLAKHENAGVRAAAFWEFQGQFSRHTMRAAFAYADLIGVERPHTSMTIKPAGTTSKLFGLTEGWHLAAMAYYLRWVQFRSDSPQIAEYRAKGYKTRDLTTYQGTTIVGFPTEPTIASLGMGDELVLAGDASPQAQYDWLKLGEFFWIEGGSAAEYLAGNGPRPGEERQGGQISYTLKYKFEDTSYQTFLDTLRANQPYIRACSVMPQTDAANSAYEYLPEESVTKVEYEEISRSIAEAMVEEFDEATMMCEGGACPVDIKPRIAA